MGLIKTAMMTGGGIYAVNKIAKTAETHHSNPQYREQSHNPERSHTPPQYQTSAQARGVEGSGSRGNAPPGYWYSAEHDAYYPIPRASQGDKSNDADFSSQRGYQDQGTINEQSVTPPPYASRRSERPQGESSTSSRGDLAGQAIDFIMGATDGKKRNSGEGFGKRFG